MPLRSVKYLLCELLLFAEGAHVGYHNYQQREDPDKDLPNQARQGVDEVIIVAPILRIPLINAQVATD